jgi:hypothetical protein
MRRGPGACDFGVRLAAACAIGPSGTHMVCGVYACVRVRESVCVRACVRACVCVRTCQCGRVCAGAGGHRLSSHHGGCRRAVCMRGCVSHCPRIAGHWAPAPCFVSQPLRLLPWLAALIYVYSTAHPPLPTHASATPHTRLLSWQVHRAARTHRYE